MNKVAYIHIALEVWGILFCLIALICMYVGNKEDNKSRKVLSLMQLLNAFLLLADSFAWAYRGNTTTLGYYMVRVSNFCVYITNYTIMSVFTYYVLCCIEYRDKFIKWLSRVVYAISAIAIVTMVINIFNAMIYTYDANNLYTRQSLFWITQIWGIVGGFIDVIILVKYRKYLSKNNFIAMISYIVLPLVAMIIQIFVYGIALLNIAITVSFLFMFIAAQLEQSKMLASQERKNSEMQMKIMLSQIQPHFLYNSLNSIYYLCDKDKEAAQKAISDFSDYLRGNMDSLKQTTPVTFEKELEHTKVYLSLEKMRFDDELNIVYDIQASNFRLPALSVQPLVENAVKYGVGKAANGGTVTIATKELKDEYEIRVVDDGVGYDPYEVQEDGRTHVGIDNVKNRLKSMCGGSLEITSIKGEGTEAVIRLPK